MLRKLGLHTAQRWLDELRSGVGLINPTEEDYAAAAAEVLRYPDQPITLFDATTAVVADALQVEVWTFDHHFAILGAKVWSAYA